jgi:hypothetical protein
MNGATPSADVCLQTAFPDHGICTGKMMFVKLELTSVETLATIMGGHAILLFKPGQFFRNVTGEIHPGPYSV